MSFSVKSVTLRIHALPDHAAPSPPCPSPFLTGLWALWPATNALGRKHGSWAMTWAPVRPSLASQHLSAGESTAQPPPHLRGRSPRFLTQGRESLAERGRQVLSNPARSQAAPGQEPQLIILSITTPGSRWAGPATANSRAWPGQRGKLSERWIYVLWHSLSTPHQAACFL